jgi:hypothetical protein
MPFHALACLAVGEALAAANHARFLRETSRYEPAKEAAMTDPDPSRSTTRRVGTPNEARNA